MVRRRGADARGHLSDSRGPVALARGRRVRAGRLFLQAVRVRRVRRVAPRRFGRGMTRRRSGILDLWPSVARAPAATGQRPYVIHRVDTLPHNINDCIKDALIEVEALMQAAFVKVGGVAPAGSALDQAGLSDGRVVVLDYLAHGEPGLALEHLIYMVHEPDLPISRRTYACIEYAGTAMGMEKRLWERIRPTGDAADG